jgi:hypothetical protein
MPALEQSILGNGGNPELSSAVTIAPAQPERRCGRLPLFGIDLATADLGHLPTFTRRS